ncbi:MAG TPA: MarR family transcriptional regulator [Actinomycetes bacterium]|nr:MarR family transcriptional regulator [Actinomycetes bacterium]
MTDTDAGTRGELAEEILGGLARRHSTATVLFHHAVADRLGLGPTDHKCLDLLLERGPMTGSELAAITGLTSGAISGVVARLEQTGRLDRVPHPHDGRKQVLSPSPQGIQDVLHVFETVRADTAPLLEGFDTNQLAAIAQFLTRATELAYRRAAILRAQKLLPSERASPVKTGDKGST